MQFVKSPPKKGASELRAEAVSNAYLGKSRRLGARQLAALAKLGWKSPTRAPGEQRDPAGSPNFFRDFAVPFPSARIARMAVRTLANVLGVRHPRDLEYRCFQEPGGTDVLVPILGISPLRPKAQEEPSFASTRDRILLALKEASKIDDLAYDEDGDIPVRYGEARLFVRVHDSPRSARVFSPVLQREELTEPVLRRLNELNTGASFVRFLHANGTIWASSDVLGHPLLPAHVVHACHVVGKVVNDLRDRLALELEDGAATTASRPALLH